MSKKIIIFILSVIMIISCENKKADFILLMDVSFPSEVTKEPLKTDEMEDLYFLECRNGNCRIYRGTVNKKDREKARDRKIKDIGAMTDIENKKIVYEKNIDKKKINQIAELLEKLEQKGSEYDQYLKTGILTQVFKTKKDDIMTIFVSTSVPDEAEEIFNILEYKNSFAKSDTKYLKNPEALKFSYENTPLSKNDVCKLYCKKEKCEVLYYRVPLNLNALKPRILEKDINKNLGLIKKWELNLGSENVEILKKRLLHNMGDSRMEGSFHIMVFDNGKEWRNYPSGTYTYEQLMGEYGKIINELIKDDYKRIEDEARKNIS